MVAVSFVLFVFSYIYRIDALFIASTVAMVLPAMIMAVKDFRKSSATQKATFKVTAK